MQLKNNIAISDSGFIFNPTTGDSFSTNPIGLEIIKLIKENKTEEDIKKYISENYLVDIVTFEKDLYDFKNMLAKQKIIDTNE